MHCNGLPERNIGFIPYVKRILSMLDDGERLAIEPQLILSLGGREMNKQEREAEKTWIDEEARDYNAECDRIDATEVPREVQSRSVLHHKQGVCPQCDIGDLWVVCSSKAYAAGTHDAARCDYCQYVDNR